MKSLRRAFTLVELLVVIAIIGILVALLLPAIQAAREASRRSACQNGIRQIQLGIINYEDSNKKYPPGRSGCDGITDGPCAGAPDPGPLRNGASAFVMILPFIEEKTLYDSINFKPDGLFDLANKWQSTPQNLVAVKTRIGLYICPSDQGVGETHDSSGQYALGNFAVNMGHKGPSTGHASKGVKWGNSGVFEYVTGIKRRQIIDGTSKTMFVGEAINGHMPDNPNRWATAGRYVDSMRVTENPVNTPPTEGVVDTTTTGTPTKMNGAFASRHTGGAFFTFGDGHTSFIEDTISMTIYRALSTKAAISGEPIVSSEY